MLGAVVVALTHFGSGVGRECAKPHGVNSISGFGLPWFLNALSHFVRNAGTFTLAAVRKLS